MLRRKKFQPPTEPTIYPHGTCVETETGYFLIRDGKKYRVPTQRILDSWAFPRIVQSSDSAVSKYRLAALIGFRDGSLIYNLGDGKIYLISNNKRRQITSPEALERLGVKREDALLVSKFEVNLQELGEEIE